MKDIFHSAALKLTLWYLGIIMVLSIGLSGIIYHLSSNELARDARRQVTFFNNQLSTPDYPVYDQFQQSNLDQGNRNLRNNLVIFNLLVLVGGGFASYLLARRTLQPIEDALESQKRFTGDASHELRTPLTVIQAENEVALRNPSLTKTQAVDLLKSNLEEVAKLRALSDGLLKLHSGKEQGFSVRPIALDEVAQAAIGRWQKIADSRKITIRTNLDKVSALGERDSLVELVSILVDNAVKYSARGGQIKVSVGAQDKDAYVRVEDEGEGIRSSDLPHIFDRFFRADHSRSKNTREGYGLGLAIAKKIADLHGAAIEVKSTLGKGSTFTLRLPRTSV